MWRKHILQISMIFIMFILIAYIYNFNMKQLTNKQKMIEKFKEVTSEKINDEVPKPFTKNDYNIYANIIGVFKHNLGKEPTKEELFACYHKIKSKEMSLSEIDALLEKEPKNYRLFLFPEAEKHILKENSTIDDEKTKENDHVNDNDYKDDDHDDDLNVHDNEKGTEVMDENNRVQYIINRPTVYNIGTNTFKKGLDSLSSDVNETTKRIVESVKNTKANLDIMEEDEEDNNIENNEDHAVTQFKEVEKKKYRNRCQTQQELEEQNKLAIKRSERNINELSYGCKRNSVADDLAHKYDDMVLRHDQLWKMPERYPPVCNIDSKRKCNVNPVEVQSALIGTLLDDAQDTEVGSIMPQFKYNEKKNKNT